MTEFPIGTTLDSGAWTITETLFGDVDRGVYRARGRDGTTALVTTAPPQTKTERLQMHSQYITELLHIGPLSRGGYDGMVEREPPGVPLGESKRPVDVAIEITIELSTAAAHAHARGLVLQGMRPQLIYIDPGTFRVTGIAPRCEPFLTTASPSSQGAWHPFDHWYMPAEALNLDFPAPPRDVFSVGAILATMLTGEHPFVGDDPITQLSTVAANQRRPWTGPQALTAIVDRAMALDRTQRPTALDLMKQLQALSE